MGAHLKPHMAKLREELSCLSTPYRWVPRNAQKASAAAAAAAAGTSLPLGTWITVIQRCAAQVVGWAQVGPPRAVWLGGLQHPRALLASLRRACVIGSGHTATFDRVRIGTEVGVSTRNTQFVWTKLVLTGLSMNPSQVSRCMSGDALPPQDTSTTIAISGLVIHGAGWDVSDQEVVALPGNALVQQVPIVLLQAQVKTSKELALEIAAEDPTSPGERLVASRKRYYKCPLYQTNARQSEDHVLDLRMETSVAAEHWAIKGVCLLAMDPRLL